MILRVIKKVDNNQKNPDKTYMGQKGHVYLHQAADDSAVQIIQDALYLRTLTCLH